MPDSKVVDAWALLAWLRDEQPAASSVLQNLLLAERGDVQLSMSWINAGEVYYMLARKHNERAAEEFLTRIPSLPIRMVTPSSDDIVAAAKLKSTFRLSYADAFAVALAVREGAAVITGDPEMRELGSLLAVEWIGRA